MTDFLLFQLYGALASWGHTAVGEERPTSATPGKSAMAGLLAACLGVRRDEHERLAPLWQDYYLAVREETRGHLLTDYHTVQSANLGKRDRAPATRRDELNHPRVDTIISLREYLTEGAWVVCWWPAVEAPVYSLETLADALRKPALAPYLGRKSCTPGLPMAPRVVAAEDWYAALSGAPQVGAAQWGGGGDGEGAGGESLTARLPWLETPRYRWEEAAGTPASAPLGNRVVETRHDVPVHRGRWQFTRRAECVAQPAAEG